MWKEEIVTYFKHYPRIYLSRLKKRQKRSVHIVCLQANIQSWDLGNTIICDSEILFYNRLAFNMTDTTKYLLPDMIGGIKLLVLFLSSVNLRNLTQQR
jgi:hypothetical protein